MVPSLFPARSAPLGVRSLPNRSTSAGDISAMAGVTLMAVSRVAAVIVSAWTNFMIGISLVCFLSKRDSEVERNEVAVTQRVVIGVMVVGGVVQVQGVVPGVSELQPQAERVPGLRELVVDRPAAYVLRPEEVGREAHAPEHIVVSEIQLEAIAPGEGRGVTVVPASLRRDVQSRARRTAEQGARAGPEDERAVVAQRVRIGPVVRQTVPLEPRLGDEDVLVGTENAVACFDGVELKLRHMGARVSRQVPGRPPMRSNRQRPNRPKGDRKACRERQRATGAKTREQKVVAVDLSRNVVAPAEFRAHGPAQDVGRRADSEYADVLGIVPFRREWAGRAALAELDRDDRGARVDLHSIQAEFGIEGLRCEAVGCAQLAGTFGFAPVDRFYVGVGVDTKRIRPDESHGVVARSGAVADVAGGDRPVVAAAHVNGGVGPLDLVEQIEAAVLAQALVGEDDGNRQKHLLELSAWLVKRWHVDRVDLIDALNEQALAPVHDLIADAHLQRLVVDVERVVRVGVEQIDTLVAVQRLEAVV